MDAAAIAEGIFWGAVYVFLALFALRLLVVLTAVGMGLMGRMITWWQVRRM